MAKQRTWSVAETDALKMYIKTGVDIKDIYSFFPYRTKASVSHKAREVRNQIDQENTQAEVLETWIDKLRKSGPISPPSLPQETRDSVTCKELEVCILDPHFGMQCCTPESDHPWNMDLAEETCLWAIDGLLKLAEPFGPFERIIFPFGNDYLHADNIYHTTTKGTPQPDMYSWPEVYRRGKDLAIKMVEMLKRVAPVKIYQIPGNHSYHSDYTIGMILDAYFHRDANVEVDCSSSPYKFHRFGSNLIGFEHGNSIPPIRLASLMANMRPRDWAETSFREFHLGDQHRKATAKPSSFEEQGVSIEYLAGLTPPNMWHKTHAFNFQKRGAVAFVWDYSLGQQGRLCMNMDIYTGKPMGT